MPQWLSLTFGAVVGLALVAGAVFVAVRPYVQARPPKSRMPDPSDFRHDHNSASTWSNGDFSPPADGHGHDL
jgi:hypothetical protein